MTASIGMDRRALLERVLLLVGAVALGSTGVLQGELAAAAPAGSHLDASNFRLLTAVADTIIPETDSAGAIKANVPAKFDALLAQWASAERRMELSLALAAIDAKARQAYGKGFAELPQVQREVLLTAHDIEALQIDPARKTIPPNTRGGSPGYADPAYSKLKELIVTLFYLSEQALTQELSYEHSPGEWKPSIPVTSETRTAGGGQI